MINIIKKPRWFTAKLHNFFMIGAKGKAGGEINMEQLQGEQQSRRAWYCFLSQKLRSHLSWALQTRVQSWQLYQVWLVSGIEITPGILCLISCSWFGDFKDTATTVLKGFGLSAALEKASTNYNLNHNCLENKSRNKLVRMWILWNVFFINPYFKWDSKAFALRFPHHHHHPGSAMLLFPLMWRLTPERFTCKVL